MNIPKIAYCLGMSLTMEALYQRPSCLQEIWLSSDIKDNHFLAELQRLAQKYHIPLYWRDEDIHKISVKENCFVIGVFHPFQDSLSAHKKHLLLQGFHDEGYLGTCIRSAVSFDFHDIAMIGENSNIFTDKAVRSSMGAIFHCRLAFYANLRDYCKEFTHPLYRYSEKEGLELAQCVFPQVCAIRIPGEKAFTDVQGEAFHIAAQNLSLPVYSALTFYTIYQKGRS